MTLKYSTTDVDEMIDIFSTISENENNMEVIFDEMKRLFKYPTNVLQEFLKCMDELSNKDQNFLKENYMGVIGYITMRLNLC